MTERPIRVAVQLQPQHADHGEIRRAVAEVVFTVGLGGPRYDLASVRDLAAWRDSRNTL